MATRRLFRASFVAVCLVRPCVPLAATQPSQSWPGRVRVSPGENVAERDGISRNGDTC